MKLRIALADSISLSYAALRIKPIKNLPVGERSREGERAFIEFVTLFALPPGGNVHEDGVGKYEQGQCISEPCLSSPEFW